MAGGAGNPGDGRRSNEASGDVLGTLILAGSALSFSLTGLCAKMLPVTIDPPQLMLIRSTFMVVVIGLWAVARGDPLFVFKRREGTLLALRGVLGTVGFIFYFGSLQLIPLADTVILFQAHPVVIALLGPWLLGEKNRPWHWPLLAVSLAGVALVVGPSGQGDTTGRLMGLAAALVAGVAYSLIRMASSTVPALTITLSFPLAAVLLFGPAVALGAPGCGWVPPTAVEWLWMAGVGVTSTAGQILLTVGISRVPAARGSAVSNLQVVFAVLWGLMLLGEIPSPWTLAGAALVVTSVVLLNRAHPAGRRPDAVVK